MKQKILSFNVFFFVNENLNSVPKVGQWRTVTLQKKIQDLQYQQQVQQSVSVWCHLTWKWPLSDRDSLEREQSEIPGPGLGCLRRNRNKEKLKDLVFLSLYLTKYCPQSRVCMSVTLRVPLWNLRQCGIYVYVYIYIYIQLKLPI